MNYANDELENKLFNTSPFNLPSQFCGYRAELARLAEQLDAGEDGRESLYAWHPVLSRTAFRLFDYWTDRGDFETVNPRRIADARNKLSGWLYSRKKGLPHLLGISLDKEEAA